MIWKESAYGFHPQSFAFQRRKHKYKKECMQESKRDWQINLEQSILKGLGHHSQRQEQDSGKDNPGFEGRDWFCWTVFLYMCEGCVFMTAGNFPRFCAEEVTDFVHPQNYVNSISSNKRIFLIQRTVSEKEEKRENGGKRRI